MAGLAFKDFQRQICAVLFVLSIKLVVEAWPAVEDGSEVKHIVEVVVDVLAPTCMSNA